MFYTRLVILLFLLSFYKSYTAQQYSFYNYKEGNGLSKNSVLGITQLPNGEIWAGTNDGGVNILNGINIKTLSKTDGLVDNVIYDISYNNDSVYISTNGGINVYYNEIISTPIFKDSLAEKRTFMTLISRTGRKILATGKGLCELIGDTIYPITSSDSLLNMSPVIHIRESKNGDIWCSTMGNGIFILKKTGVKHITNNRLFTYTFSTFPFNDSTTWILSYQGLYSIINDSIIQLIERKDHTYYYYAIRDKKENIWITGQFGLQKISKNGNKTIFTKKNGLAANETWKVFDDKEGNIWITLKKLGISKLTSEAFVKYDQNFGLDTNIVRDIIVDNDSSRWIGTYKGLTQIINDKIINYKQNNTSKDRIMAIAKYKSMLLALSDDGINILNKEHYYNIKNINGRNDNRFAGECIYIDTLSNKILLGSFVLGVAELKTDKIILVNDSLGFPDRIGIFSIIRTKDNVLWFATEKGVYKFRSNKLERELLLSTEKTRSLTLDKEGRLWVGNSDGIFFQTQKGNFKAVYEKDTLKNNTIYSLQFDNNGILWAGKIDGIDRISIKGEEIVQIKHYDEKRGCNVGTLNNNAIAVSPNNHMWFGSDRGLFEYNPDEDYPNYVESITSITDIRLFSQPTNWREYSDSLDKNGFPIELELEYTQNYLTFDYIGICHKYPQGVEYQCKLEGFDKDWVNKGTKRSAIYGNLPPGKYTFLVKSCNNEGVWNNKPKSFSFKILPPFWQTWWFYSICIGIVIAGIISYLKIRSANIQITKKNKVIEEKNEEIMDSINYAKRIQDAMLPDSKMRHLMPNSFVFFNPKDVVSGDFYWMKRVDNKMLFAVVDCTGHGVPGAFVSMIGFSGLNRAVNEYKLIHPADILEKLADFVVESFAKHEQKSINDGMDAALCALDTETLVLEFAGANNSVYIVRKEDKPLISPNGEPIPTKDLGKLKEIKATRRPIGKSDRKIPFENHVIQLEKGDTIYLFSDGFPDQFGGERGKKYMYKSFKRFLLTIQDLPIQQQEQAIKEEFIRWIKEEYEQIDDVCVMGIKV